MKKLLHVHKNTKEQRQSREIRAALKQDCNQVMQLENICGYIVFAWDRKNGFSIGWRNESHIPSNLMVEFFKQAFNRKISIDDANEQIDMRLY